MPRFTQIPSRTYAVAVAVSVDAVSVAVAVLEDCAVDVYAAIAAGMCVATVAATATKSIAGIAATTVHGSTTPGHMCMVIALGIRAVATDHAGIPVIVAAIAAATAVVTATGDLAFV